MLYKSVLEGLFQTISVFLAVFFPVARFHFFSIFRFRFLVDSLVTVVENRCVFCS